MNVITCNNCPQQYESMGIPRRCGACGSTSLTIKKEERHTITVEYTLDDDGIWVRCSCGWDKCLGYSPSPEQVMEASREHTKEVNQCK